MTDSKSRCVVEISTDTRPIVYLTIDRLSTDHRPTIDRPSTDYRPTIDRLSTDCRPTIDRLSTDYRPTIDRLSTAISTAMSTDISVNITHSKQDPNIIGWVGHCTHKWTCCLVMWRFLEFSTVVVEQRSWISLKNAKAQRSWRLNVNCDYQRKSQELHWYEAVSGSIVACAVSGTFSADV